MVIFGVLLAILFDLDPANMLFDVPLLLIPLAGLCPDTGLGILPIPLLGALYLGLMAVSLRRVRKVRSRPPRILGHIAVVVVFGMAYAVGWYFAARAIGSAIAATAIMSF
jgi:hypothetical protein